MRSEQETDVFYSVRKHYGAAKEIRLLSKGCFDAIGHSGAVFSYVSGHRRFAPTFSDVSEPPMLSCYACATNRLQDASLTLWAYVFRRFGASDALARRLCSETLLRYHQPTMVRNPWCRKCSSFITYSNKSNAAARIF